MSNNPKAKVLNIRPAKPHEFWELANIHADSFVDDQRYEWLHPHRKKGNDPYYYDFTHWIYVEFCLDYYYCNTTAFYVLEEQNQDVKLSKSNSKKPKEEEGVILGFMEVYLCEGDERCSWVHCEIYPSASPCCLFL